MDFIGYSLSAMHDMVCKDVVAGGANKALGLDTESHRFGVRVCLG